MHMRVEGEGVADRFEGSTGPRERFGGISADLLIRWPLFEEGSLSDVLATGRELGRPLR